MRRGVPLLKMGNITGCSAFRLFLEPSHFLYIPNRFSAFIFPSFLVAIKILLAICDYYFTPSAFSLVVIMTSAIIFMHFLCRICVCVYVWKSKTFPLCPCIQIEVRCVCKSVSSPNVILFAEETEKKRCWKREGKNTWSQMTVVGLFFLRSWFAAL